MKARSLRLALLRQQATLQELMPGGSTDEVAAFLSALEPYDDLELPAIVDALTKGQARRSKSRTPRAPPAENSAAISTYVSRLSASKESQEEFNEVVGQLKADKALKVADIKAIANGFRGVSDTYKNKREAMLAIENRQLSESRGRSRQERIREIF
jgi:hypothetical protein